MANDILNSSWLIQLSPIEKLVLVSLADRADKQGRCYPGMEDMLSRTGASERSIRRAIHKLERHGHITVQRRVGISSVYTVHPCHSGTTTHATVAPLPVSESHPTPATQSRHPCHGGTLTLNNQQLTGARVGEPDGPRAPGDEPATAEMMAELRQTLDRTTRALRA